MPLTFKHVPPIFGIVDHLPSSFSGETSVGGKVRQKTGVRSEVEKIFLRFWSCSVCGRSVKMHAMIGGAASSMAAAKRKVHRDTRILNFPPAPSAKLILKQFFRLCLYCPQS